MKKFLSSASLLAAVAALVLAPQFAQAAITVVPEAGTASLIGAAAVPFIGIVVMLRNRRK